MYETELRNIIEKRGVHQLTGAPDYKVKEIEDRLNVTLPDSYKWLVKEYGSVSFDGLEIDGMGLNHVHKSLDNTLNWKSHEIPDGFVVIFEPGADWIYCLDTTQLHHGECPVVAWYPGEKRSEIEADNLYEFILKFS